ncbi:MAG: hypothetical protein ACK56I_35835, partial [bacterium]
MFGYAEGDGALGRARLPIADCHGYRYHTFSLSLLVVVPNERPPYSLPAAHSFRGGPSHAPSACLRQSHTRARSARGPRVALADGRPGGHWPGQRWHWRTEGRGGTGPDSGGTGGRKAGVA